MTSAARAAAADRSLLIPAAAALLTLDTAFALHRVTATGPLAAAAGAAVLAAVVASYVLTARLRQPPILTLMGTAVLWFAFAPALIGIVAPAAGIGPAATPHALRLLLTGSYNGWWRILATVPPAGADPQVLAAASAATALAAFAAVEIALRTGRALLALTPALVLLVIGLLAGGPGSDMPEAVALVAGAASVAAFDGTRTQRLYASRGSGRSRRRTLTITGAVAIGVAALCGGAVAQAGSPTPYDVHRLVGLPQSATSTVNPLDQVGAWLLQPSTDLFTESLTAPAGAAPSTVRLLVLDRFDGQDWTSDAQYTATGSRVPPDPQAGGATSAAPASATVTQTVTIKDLRTSWLPAAVRPLSIAGAGTGVGVDAAGDLFAPSGDPAGLTYTVVSQVPQYTVAQLRYAAPGAAAADLALPGTVPAIISQTARTAVAGAVFPYQQADLLAKYLRGNEKADPTAASGHGYGQLAYFLATSHRGTSEQFATAFAVMARSLGLPTRIAVGFALPQAAGHTAAPVPVTGANALVWPEVDFSGLGWVPFYPTPSEAASGGAAAVPAGESSARNLADNDLAAPAPAVAQQQPHHSTGPQQKSSATQRASSGAAVWPDLAIGAVTVLLLMNLTMVAVPILRRARRRRSRDPGRAVLGAWNEALLQVGLLGLPRGPSRTTAQICSFGAGRFSRAPEGADAQAVAAGAAALAALAVRADQVGFSPAPVGAEAAAAAWRDLEALRRAVRRTVPARRRWKHAALRLVTFAAVRG